MAGSSALASVGAGLVRTDGCARDLAGDRRENTVAFQVDAALLQRFTRNHESGNAGFHIRCAKTKDFAVANGAAPFDHTHGVDAVGIDLLPNRFDPVARIPVEDKIADLTLRPRRARDIAKL